METLQPRSFSICLYSVLLLLLFVPFQGRPWTSHSQSLGFRLLFTCTSLLSTSDAGPSPGLLCSPPLVTTSRFWLEEAFSALAPFDIWGQVLLCGGGCPVHCGWRAVSLSLPTRCRTDSSAPVVEGIRTCLLEFPSRHGGSEPD